MLELPLWNTHTQTHRHTQLNCSSLKIPLQTSTKLLKLRSHRKRACACAHITSPFNLVRLTIGWRSLHCPCLSSTFALGLTQKEEIEYCIPHTMDFLENVSVYVSLENRHCEHKQTDGVCLRVGGHVCFLKKVAALMPRSGNLHSFTRLVNNSQTFFLVNGKINNPFAQFLRVSVLLTDILNKFWSCSRRLTFRCFNLWKTSFYLQAYVQKLATCLTFQTSCSCKIATFVACTNLFRLFQALWDAHFPRRQGQKNQSLFSCPNMRNWSCRSIFYFLHAMSETTQHHIHEWWPSKPIFVFKKKCHHWRRTSFVTDDWKNLFDGAL